MRMTDKAIKRRMIVYMAELVIRTVAAAALVIGPVWVSGLFVHILIGG